MKRALTPLLLLPALLFLSVAARQRSSFIGTFAVDEGTWEKEALAKVEQKKVVLHESVEQMLGLIRYTSTVMPSVEIESDGKYVMRSAFFGTVYGKWTTSKEVLSATPDNTQPDISDKTFKPVPFSLRFRAGAIRYAEGVDGPSDLPMKSLKSE